MGKPCSNSNQNGSKTDIMVLTLEIMCQVTWAEIHPRNCDVCYRTLKTQS